jgi:GxxExxY protein
MTAVESMCRSFDDMKDESNLLHGDLTRSIIGAMYAVHSQLGFGFLEAVYKNALAVVLEEAGLRVEREVPFEIIFHGRNIGLYRADLVVESKVLVETKTGRHIDPVHIELIDNYLCASELEVGLLLNFGLTAQFKRRIRTSTRPPGYTPKSA